MNLKPYIKSVLALIIGSVAALGCTRGGDCETGINGKPLNETIGITHAGICYTHNESVSGMKDGADRVRQLGSKVIKLWFSDDPHGAYSVNHDWSRFEINNSVELLKTDYYKEVFDMDFTTYVLETHTFDKSQPVSNIWWQDGMDEEEKARLEKEMFDVSEYLMLTYNGTGKEFILQNWEGDNMLAGRFWRLDRKTGMYYHIDKGVKSVNPADDAAIRTSIQGLRDWFNVRQKGVDRAVAEYSSKSDVKIRHALEINHIYLDSRDDGWPFIDSPQLVKDIVPYTDCDLYSLSCWGSLTVERANTLRNRLVMFQDAVGDTYTDLEDGGKVKDRRPFARKGQKSRLMLGEYGAIERLQGNDYGEWTDCLDAVTDLRHRKVLQIQTDLALDLGLEFVLYWELYCNVPRTDTNPPVKIDNRAGERATSNDMLQGNWIIRVDGTFTEGYKYLKGLVDPKDGLYLQEEAVPGKVYKIGGPFAGMELSGELVSDEMLANEADRKDFGDEIVLYASTDGKNFDRIETDAFFTQCVKTDDGYIAKVKYINKNIESKDYGFFRFEIDDDTARLSEIKFYKPNKNI